MPGKRFGERTEARSQALQLLFQAQMTGRLVADVLGDDYALVSDVDSDGEARYYDAPPSEFALEIAEGADASLHELDGVINQASTNWSVSRMCTVDRDILRLAVFEMLYRDDIDVAVSINEYVDLAKAYGTDESSRFVNGLLGRVARMIDAGELEGVVRRAQGEAEAEDEPEDDFEDEAEDVEAEDAPEAAEDAGASEPAEDEAAEDDDAELPDWARE